MSGVMFGENGEERGRRKGKGKRGKQNVEVGCGCSVGDEDKVVN